MHDDTNTPMSHDTPTDIHEDTTEVLWALMQAHGAAEDLCTVINSNLVALSDDAGDDAGDEKYVLNATTNSIAATITRAEAKMYHICDALLTLHQWCESTCPIDLDAARQALKTEGHSLLGEVVIDTSDFFAVRSPVLRRSFMIKMTSPCYNCLYLTALVNGHIDPTPYRDGINMYTCTIYPSGTQPHQTIDPDNLNLKAIADPICAILGIDDNGIDVTRVLGTATSDVLIPGTYTVVTPQATPIMTIKQVAQLIESHTPTPN